MTTRILIFEDNESLRNSIAFVLKKFNYEVKSYSNPKEVDLKLIKSANKTDLVLSDFDMPFLNGIELLKSLQKVNFRLENFAMMSSDYPEMESELKPINDLNIRFFHKPFSLCDLLDWAENCRKNLNGSCLIPE